MRKSKSAIRLVYFSPVTIYPKVLNKAAIMGRNKFIDVYVFKLKIDTTNDINEALAPKISQTH